MEIEKKFVKKEEVLSKFMQHANGCTSKHKFEEAAEKTINELNIDGGAFIYDFELNDFKGTRIKKERAEQIVNRSKLERKISPNMIIEYLVAVGNDVLTPKDVKTKREYGSHPVQLCSKLTNDCYARLAIEAKKQNASMSVIIEKAVVSFLGRNAI